MSRPGPGHFLAHFCCPHPALPTAWSQLCAPGSAPCQRRAVPSPVCTEDASAWRGQGPAAIALPWGSWSLAGGLCRHVAGRAAVCAVGPLECPLDVRVGTAWARARRPRLGSPDPVEGWLCVAQGGHVHWRGAAHRGGLGGWAFSGGPRVGWALWIPGVCHSPTFLGETHTPGGLQCVLTVTMCPGCPDSAAHISFQCSLRKHTGLLREHVT